MCGLINKFHKLKSLNYYNIYQNIFIQLLTGNLRCYTTSQLSYELNHFPWASIFLAHKSFDIK